MLNLFRFQMDFWISVRDFLTILSTLREEYNKLIQYLLEYLTSLFIFSTFHQMTSFSSKCQHSPFLFLKNANYFIILNITLLFAHSYTRHSCWSCNAVLCVLCTYTLCAMISSFYLSNIQMFAPFWFKIVLSSTEN